MSDNNPKYGDANTLYDNNSRPVLPTTISDAALARAREEDLERSLAGTAEWDRQQAAAKAANEQALREAGEREMASAKEQMRLRWNEGGGDAAGFERAWPDLKDELLRKRALGGEAQAERLAQELKATGRYCL